MTDIELRNLIQQTMDAQYEADSFSDEAPTRAVPHPPATGEEIRRLETYLRSRELSLPPSFAQFISLYNGIDNYIPSMDLSIRSTQAIERSAKGDSGWRDLSSAHRFVFAAGEAGAFAGFVPETLDSAGEMAVAMFNELGEVTKYENLNAFLEDQLEYYQSVVRAEKADRVGLKDD